MWDKVMIYESAGDGKCEGGLRERGSIGPVSEETSAL